MKKIQRKKTDNPRSDERERASMIRKLGGHMSHLGVSKNLAEGRGAKSEGGGGDESGLRMEGGG